MGLLVIHILCILNKTKLTEPLTLIVQSVCSLLACLATKSHLTSLADLCFSLSLSVFQGSGVHVKGLHAKLLTAACYLLRDAGVEEGGPGPKWEGRVPRCPGPGLGYPNNPHTLTTPSCRDLRTVHSVFHENI